MGPMEFLGRPLVADFYFAVDNLCLFLFFKNSGKFSPLQNKYEITPSECEFIRVKFKTQPSSVFLITWFDALTGLGP